MVRRFRHLVCAAAIALATPADAHTVTFNWTWPTVNQDGTTLQLTAIANAVIYDQAVPVPGLPGTVVTCPVTTLPPTSSTGTCTTGTQTPGSHSYVLAIENTALPTTPGALTSALAVTIPQSTPAAATGFSATVNNP